LVVVLYSTLPEWKDPVLQAQVSIGPRAWPKPEAPDARLVPSAVLKNPTQEDWQNVNLSINEQFHFTHPGSIKAGEEIVVPLKFFHTKGNQYFPPESQPLKLLTIYAQIPSGARAILEVDGSQLAQGLQPGTSTLVEQPHPHSVQGEHARPPGDGQ
jgi:hypothetical protein